MAPQRSETWDITIRAGTTWRRTLRWSSPRLDVNGNIERDENGKKIYDPVDTTGWKAKMQIRDRMGGRLLMTLGTADVNPKDGTITMGGDSGVILFDLPFAKTEMLRKFGNAVHDVELESPDGTIKLPWASGTVAIEQGVTQ